MNAVTQESRLTLIDDEPAASQPLVVQKTQSLAVPENSPAGMMLSAMSRGASLEQVEKMMDLQDRWEKREAEKAFNDAMAAFKGEVVEIIKRKHVHFVNKSGGQTDYKHAELSDVVEAVGPPLSKHGFSWRWNTEQDGSSVIVTCILKHRLGHSESCTLSGPYDQSGGKNAIQAIISAKTYLERQTLKAICGVAEKGEDTDGGGTGDGPGPITQKILKGLLDDLKVTKTDDAAAALWLSGSKTLAATESKEAYQEFKDSVLAHRRELKEAGR